MPDETAENTSTNAEINTSRAFELLWGDRERPSRGPKPGLSVDGIVDAAIKIADAEGLAALSMRRVASQFGLTTMSLYRYVPGKEELIEAMFHAGTGPPPHPSDDPTAWRGNLTTWARENYATFHRHPWMLSVATVRRVMGPYELAWFEAGLTALAGTGLTHYEMADTIFALNGYVRGAAQVTAHSPHPETITGVADANWWSGVMGLSRTDAGGGRFPMVSALVAAGVFQEQPGEDPDRAFTYGLDRFLDGVQANLDAKRN